MRVKVNRLWNLVDDRPMSITGQMVVPPVVGRKVVLQQPGHKDARFETTEVIGAVWEDEDHVRFFTLNSVYRLTFLPTVELVKDTGQTEDL